MPPQSAALIDAGNQGRQGRAGRRAQALATARSDAALHLARDPELKSPRGEALRVLLYLFEQDEGVRNLKSG